MAQTINRNNEISPQQVESLKKMFNEKCFSKALYKGIKALVNDFPKIANQLSIAVYMMDAVTKKHEEYTEAVKCKKKNSKTPVL